MKSHYSISKYVYRKMLNGKFTRCGSSRTLLADFPKVAIMFDECGAINVRFRLQTGDPGVFLPAKAWIDKHGNIIVRIFHEDKQTKINF